MRARSSSCESFSSNHGFFRGGNARESLNQLRLSLNRSLMLPCIDKDSEEYMSISEDDVKELKVHIDSIRNSHDENLEKESANGENSLLYSAEGCETEFTCEQYLSCSEESETEEINSSKTTEELVASVDGPENVPKISMIVGPPSRSSLSISGCHQSPPPVLQGPMLSESPKIKNSQRKSSVFSLNNDVVQASNNVDPTRQSQSHQPESIRSSSLRSSRIFAGPTDSLAASLQRGLQVIESHRRDSAPSRSSVSFSFEHLALNKPCLSAEKVNASVQTSQSGTFICTKCQCSENSEVDDSSKVCGKLFLF